MTKPWSKVSSLYQIYPRSFQDLNGDGVGDLAGITMRLPYLAELGIDAVWISPFFPSPMKDFGYDITNYRDIDPQFGTLDDFRTLLEMAHRHNIKVMIDFVPCHTSSEHPWFREAKRSRASTFRNYYVWRDAKPDGSPPNNWRSISGGSAWTFDAATGQYYLHSFLSAQPDLNWDNPAVRQEMKQIMRWWFNLGVDGMRVDAIWGISKDPQLGNDSPNPDFSGDPGAYGAHIHDHCKHGPHFTDYLKEMAAVCDEYDDKRLVFEFYPDEKLGDIYQQYAEVLSVHPRASAFFMEYRQNHWHADDTKNAILRYLEHCTATTPFFCIGNHDQPRVASRLGHARARALSFLNLLTPGVSVVYYGDEIGMENGVLNENDVRDNFSPQHRPEDSRDLERTPMQWTAAPNAGFSVATPWLPIHQNYTKLNVQTQLQDTESLLNLHKQLLHLRKTMPLITHGTVREFRADSGYVLGLEYAHQEQTGYLLVNFADSPQEIHLPRGGKVIASTALEYPIISKENDITLSAYAGVFVLAR